MDTLKKCFEKKESEKKGFNIFSALHKETDERRLHSRFIAYLLSSKSHHGMGNKFLKSFIEIVLNKVDFDYRDCTIKPEYKNIDIFIYNDKQSIIIENKIYAGEQEGQLERYNKAIEEEEKYKDITIVYLTLEGRKPSAYSFGKLKLDDIICVSYRVSITNWLSDCISISENENKELLSQIISQYKTLITKLTSDLDFVDENKIIISKKIVEAWELESESNFFTKKYSDIFKHIKWHTVADFINELENALKEKGAREFEKPDLDSITRVTHNNSNQTKLIIKFKYNNATLQIVNDAKGFTLGNLTAGKWGAFSDETRDIKFYDFSNENTFYLIKKEKRSEVIKNIINEVDKEYNNLIYTLNGIVSFKN